MAADDNGRFAGKVAFVTGAGSGIGRATALEFARQAPASWSPICPKTAAKKRPG